LRERERERERHRIKAVLKATGGQTQDNGVPNNPFDECMAAIL